MNHPSPLRVHTGRTGRPCRPTRIAMLGLIATAAGGLAACDLGKVTVGTTSKVLARAQPSLKQEADYDLAARAIPGTLKTVEGFWYVDKENAVLTLILAEGYCQYGQGFVEDEWELALLDGRLDDADYIAARATKMYVRCMNYAFLLLGSAWQEKLFSDAATAQKLIAGVGAGKRNALMWAAIGLAGAINQNLDKPELIAQAPVVQAMLERVVQLDDAHGHRDPALRALPHIALGMLHLARSPALGGDPKLSKLHFDRAVQITDGKFLLAKVLYARRYAVGMQDRTLFRKTLVDVLRTAPSIWPDQRLANEIAHRRARRYLKQEKEWF